MMEDRLDSDAPRAALIYAAMSMAHNDSMVACWDAKYTYWAIRPFQLDPDVKTLFATPNHPSFPAAARMRFGGDRSGNGTLLPDTRGLHQWES
jgi:hypothetical protein